MTVYVTKQLKKNQNQIGFDANDNGKYKKNI